MALLQVDGVTIAEMPDGAAEGLKLGAKSRGLATIMSVSASISPYYHPRVLEYRGIDAQPEVHPLLLRLELEYEPPSKR